MRASTKRRIEYISEIPLVDIIPSIEDEDIPAAVIAIEDDLKPTAVDDVRKMLGVVAEVLGVSLPSTAALQVYLDLLRRYPPDLLTKAGQGVMENFRFNSFPRPGDFVKYLKEHHEARLILLTKAKYARDAIAWRERKEAAEGPPVLLSQEQKEVYKTKTAEIIERIATAMSPPKLGG